MYVYNLKKAKLSFKFNKLFTNNLFNRFFRDLVYNFIYYVINLLFELLTCHAFCNRLECKKFATIFVNTIKNILFVT